jgi:DNA-binding LytR/AlgR family response regulator
MAGVICVGVVDDEAVGRDRILEHLRHYGDEHDVVFSIRTFADGRDIVNSYHADYDIIFLDIQMPHLDGLEAARRIRRVDADVVIVFITNMVQYAVRGYEVDALSYLVKPVPYLAFAKEMGRGIARAQRAADDSFVIAADGQVTRLPINDIVYIESIRHRIILHTAAGTHSLTGTLKALEADLAPRGFYRSNNCYLVNLRHVTAVDQTTCTLLDGVCLQVSRPRRRGFLDALTDYLGGRLT